MLLKGLNSSEGTVNPERKPSASAKYVKANVFAAQSCPTWTVAPPGSSVHGILQARMLEWVAIPFSRGSSQPRDRIKVSCTCTQIDYP